MAKLLFVFALTATLAVLTYAAAPRRQYCNLPNCKGRVHTACQFPFLMTSPSCGKVISSTLTPAEENELLEAHNKYRALVASGQEKRGSPGPQPASSNLRPLQWDRELAAIAQTWADQCDYGHDQCRNVAAHPVGQNVASMGTTGPLDSKLTEMVTMWYDEVALFNRNNVKSVTGFSKPKVGHYTQMVWATTTHVGCGAVRYNADGVWNRVYLVCNYGPAGNWIGQEMYKTR